MTITWKEILLAVLITVGAFCLGLWVGYERDKAKFEQDIKKLEEVNEQRKAEIDSLREDAGRIDSVITEIKIKERVIDTIRIKETERLRVLPLSESVRLLQSNLQKYENYTPQSL